MKKDNSFFATVMHVGLGTIINMIIGFICTPIITRLVLPEEYGRLSIFTLYIGMATMVLSLGLDQSLVRYYYAEKTIDYKRWILKNCICPVLVSSFVISIVFITIIKLQLFPFEFSDMPLILIIGVFGEIIYRFSSLVLRLEGKGQKYAISSIIYKSIYVVFVFVLIFVTGNASFKTLAYSTVIAYVIAALYGIWNEKAIWSVYRNKQNFPISKGEIIKYGFPFILSLGLTTLFNAIDKLSLKTFCDYSTVGIYASATTIIGVFSIVQSSFNTVWAPVAVKHYENDPTDKAFYTRYNRIISFVMFAFGISFIMCKDIFGLLLGRSYREAAQIVPFLALHPIMYTISETTVTGIVVKKKSSLHLIVAAVACVVNYAGNTILVPMIGAKGAAISTGISYIVFYLLRTLLADRFYSFEHHKVHFWISTLVVIVFALYNTFTQGFVVDVILYIVTMGIVVLLYLDVVKNIVKKSVEILNAKILRKG